MAHEARRRVHDIYSLRCVPQVLGPVREALAHVRATVEIELNSVTDNPVCFADTEEVISGGNFHGHPIAVASDYLKTAVSSIGTFSERRIAGLLDSRTSGLPDLLTPRPAQNSGFMLVQYAAASLASENKTLSHPSSVDSIVTAGGAEDFNSMSATAARHLRDVVANTTRIVAMEMLCAAQALDMAGGTNATGVAAAQAVIRTEVPFVGEDEHILSHLVAAVESLIRDGRVQRAVGEALVATD
jgi:histidine ammonia-lyase